MRVEVVTVDIPVLERELETNTDMEACSLPIMAMMEITHTHNYQENATVC